MHVKKRIGAMYHAKKKIGGRHYWYLQRSERHGKQVKTRSVYVGPVGASFRALKVGLVLASSRMNREMAFRSTQEIFDRQRRDEINRSLNEPQFEVKFERGDKLGMRSEVTVEEVFKHESGIGYRDQQKAEQSSATPSSEGEQSSDQGDANG